MTLVLSAFAMSAYAALDLRANEQPLPVTRDPQAIAKIPPGYRFVEPGTLTVAISALNSPPLALLASDNRTRIGSDPDIARLLAGSLGLKLRLVPTAWGGLAAGHRLRPLRCGADQYRGNREAQREVRFCDLPGGLPGLLGEIHQRHRRGKRTRRSRGAQSDRRVRHQSGADPAGLERGQPRRRTAAGPAGLPDR
ncbi:amino acid ABC transporter periplasmic amino acid-binding protein [Klebsiella pneumoniae]|uniref:Amino acid ABC transporter periplasmic amino acid-binding protein n=1 Tax=Klebsiella pneumoniae TaxID=573 RepID=A0A377V1P7_KLEPN|nr:amino acid ABC transporter periplasmic amino acid-binding protein [Klebsiella pneumoniae]